MEILKKTSGNFENKVSEATKGAQAAKQTTPPVQMSPINTRITDIKQSVITPSKQSISAAPSGDIKQRIAESNLLDQFIRA